MVLVNIYLLWSLLKDNNTWFNYSLLLHANQFSHFHMRSVHNKLDNPHLF